MDLDKGRGYAWKAGLLIFTSGFVGACAANSPVTPSVFAEGPTSTSQFIPALENPLATFTPMPDDPILNYAVPRDVNATNAVATAEAVGTPEGLAAKDNFPELIRKSQRPIELTARFFFSVDGQGWQDDLPDIGMGGTLVKDSRYPNKIFYVTAGHSFDFEHLKPDELKDLSLDFGIKQINFTHFQIHDIVIDGIPFNADQFGVDNAYIDPNTQSGVDRAVIAIDQQSVPTEVWARWTADAIPTEDITYSSKFADQKYFGVCNSAAAGYRLVVGENMTLVREKGNFIAIAPYTSDLGCSGTAIGSRREIGQSVVKDELMGINVGTYVVGAMSTTVTQVYSFADWTQAGFEASMLKAVGANNDGLLRQINATPTPISP